MRCVSSALEMQRMMQAAGSPETSYLCIPVGHDALFDASLLAFFTHECPFRDWLWSMGCVFATAGGAP
jgi:hypothetical protein